MKTSKQIKERISYVCDQIAFIDNEQSNLIAQFISGEISYDFYIAQMSAFDGLRNQYKITLDALSYVLE